MRLTWILLPVIAVGVIATGLLLASSLTRAQVGGNPTLAIDMVPADNVYCGGDGFLSDGVTACSPPNSMTVAFNPATDFCLATDPANTATHNHNAHVIVQNVEDLIGWQVRFDYTGDQFRPNTFSPIPFTDNNTGQNISFNNLPIDAATLVHRDLISASNIPPSAAGPQSAGIGASYIGSQDFPISPDTPAKAVPDDASYTAPTGGVLASVLFQVVGDQSGQLLFMDNSAVSPFPFPGSGVAIFDGTGLVDRFLPESALGDASHAEGAACQAATPTATPTPGPAATATTPGPGVTPTPGPGGTPTRTPTPGAAAGTPTRTPTPRVTPTALPPTGGSSPGVATFAYALLFGTGLIVAGSGTAFAIQRLSMDEPQ